MSAIIEDVHPLGFVWDTVDPFLFCVHHLDRYPAGDAKLGPKASLAGRNLGQDFEVKDGFRMYHGQHVPGFPQHPHRGFETITIVRKGFVDHSDSLGATARYGQGDVQWMTAGSGIVHAEMFPLLNQSEPNTAELFQIWLNLPAAEKMVPPHFSMLWARSIPHTSVRDAQKRGVHLSVVAGKLLGLSPPPPPPHSWAAKPDANVGIFTLRFDAGAGWTLPPAVDPRVRRTIYVFDGPMVVAGKAIAPPTGVRVRSDAEVTLEAPSASAEVLVLEGRPIGEPVVQHGPFVLNSVAGVRQAFVDYQRTQFGGWPWPSDDHVHPREAGRFAKRPDGTIERPPV